MTGKSPLVSIIIPTYNRAAFVVKAVDSILNQTFTDYEVIVVDDGSTDSTAEALRQYGDQIRYIHQENAGPSAARNKGITLSMGKWVAFLDSDDEWEPDYLAEQIRHADNISGLCMQSANCRRFDSNGNFQTFFEISGAMAAFTGTNYVLIEEPLIFLIRNWGFQLGSVIFLRDAIIKADLFHEKLRISEDLDFMARVSLQGTFGLLNKELVNIYRRRESTESLTSEIEKNPRGVIETDIRIYERLKQTQTLSSRELKTLNWGISRKKRAMGNLFWQKGNKTSARACYKQAVLIDPSPRSIGKYLLSYLYLPQLKTNP